MIVLVISLTLKGLWLYCIYRFFLGACLSKISVQMIENASSPCTLSSCLNELRKFRYESPYIKQLQLLSFCESQIALSLLHMYF